MQENPHKHPIAVDLDGTLIHSDTLHEGLVHLLTRRPWLILPLLLRLLHGKAAFKRYVTQQGQLETATIPANRDLLDYLQEEKAKGRRIGLFSAADQSIVDAFAERFPIFDTAIGSDGAQNLSGANKLDIIRRHLGPEFVYAGDASVDLPIWRASAGAIVVGRSRRVRAKLVRTTAIERDFPTAAPSLRTWVNALRIHQWAKNSLVFVPGLLSLPVLTSTDLIRFALAFAALCAIASATYLINDLADLAADRAHHSKRERPFAACTLPLGQGVAAAVALTLLGAALAWFLPDAALLPIAVYAVTTLAYSFGLKKVAMLDVLCLGFLFTLRIATGAALFPAEPPYWLFAFSMFFFSSLALVKRYAELITLIDQRKATAAGRGYEIVDAPVVLAAGMGTAMGSLIVFLIYLADQHFNEALFSRPAWLGLAGTVLAYWLLRVWLLAVRGKMHDDPVLFALKDRVSYTLGAIVALSLLLAW